VNLLAVAGGGALGATLRYLVGLWFTTDNHANWPWATLSVNVAGSALLGAVAIYAIESGSVSTPMRLFLAVGLCGGFTTFSSFAYETLDVATRGMPLRAGGYALLSVTLCLVAVFAGGALGQMLARR
jgi:CrcB protein